MKLIFKDADGEALTVEAGSESIAADGTVRVFALANERTTRRDEPAAVLSFAPDEARALADALHRAADEAESHTSEVARLRADMAKIDDVLRSAGIDYPGGVAGVRDLAALFQAARGDED
jgi:ABC-type nitrate/sulfonate/bicarbonate transport system substrate-binding protein